MVMETKVYQAICNVTEELSRIGISKDRKNQQQGYNFRGIDDVYCVLSGLLAKHKLCILPRVIERNVTEHESSNGKALFYTVVTMCFDIVSAEDGSRHTVTTIGEAMDSGDKSSNKAQSAAYKYMAFQTFCIPTQGDNDADEHTHEVAASKKTSKASSHEPVDAALLEQASAAAHQGTEAYTAFWHSLTTKQQHAIGEQRHADFWAIATEVAEQA